MLWTTCNERKWASRDGDGTKEEAEFAHLNTSHSFIPVAAGTLGTMGPEVGTSSMTLEAASWTLHLSHQYLSVKV